MIIAIVGPTGVGKTDLSIALAKRYQAEIVNFDSMQVYQDLNIGTAKVTTTEMEGIVHHLLSFVPLDKNYTVYDYQQDARRVIDQLFKTSKNIVMVGGTGLYLRAALCDYEFSYETVTNDYSDLTNQEMYDRIVAYQVTNPPHLHNRKRLCRLLNKLEQGQKIGTRGNRACYPFITIGLTTPRDVLYERINARVDRMLKAGLLEEVIKVKPLFATSKALQTGIGYKEFIPYFEGQCSLAEAIDTIKKNSRHYAKRQLTFFRNQFDTVWFETNYKDFAETVEEVSTYLETIIS